MADVEKWYGVGHADRTLCKGRGRLLCYLKDISFSSFPFYFVLKMYDFPVSAACSAPLFSNLEKPKELFLNTVFGQFVTSNCEQCMPWREPWLMPAQEMSDGDTRMIPLEVYANKSGSLLVI